LGLQQKFDEAHLLLDSIEPLLPVAGGRAKVRYLLERGRAFNSSKKQDQAMPLFEQAWELGQKGGVDNFAVDAAHMRAIAAPADQKLAWNLKALALAEKSTEPKARKWLGSLYNNMGWDYFEQKKYPEAMDMFTKGLAFQQEMNRPLQTRIAKWSIAKTYRMMGNLDTALSMQRELEREWSESVEKQDGYVYEELAECLTSLGRTDDATPYFARAYTLLSTDPWLIRDEPERLARLKELGGGK
jgi:tetratricopeptide (TPR) repeat protein